MKPRREHATNNEQTYFVTASTWQRRALFRNARWAELFLNTLQPYRGKGFLLHEYVLMPDHFHVLITPETTLERAAQFIKGGFSFRAKRELGSSMEIWHRGFTDHRIRGRQDYEIHVDYIYRNPVGKGLVERALDYPYCSAFPGSEKDEVPRWLKPALNSDYDGTAEAVPLQDNDDEAEAVPLQDNDDKAEAAPLQDNDDKAEAAPLQDGEGAPEAVPLQNEEASFQKEVPFQSEVVVAKQ